MKIVVETTTKPNGEVTVAQYPVLDNQNMNNTTTQLNTQVNTQNKEVINIVVIGAGIAGTAAAKELSYSFEVSNKNVNIIVLEGRDRVGGRTYTKHFSKNQVAVDLGASWIQGPCKESVKQLADELKFETIFKEWDSLSYNSKGEKLTQKYVEKMEQKFWNILSQAVRMPSKDIPLKECLDKYLKKSNAKIKDEEIFYNCLREIELVEGGSINELSSWQLDDSDDSSSDSDEEENPDVMVKEGYGKLVEKYGEGLNIKLNHIVKSINYESSQIKIETNQGTFLADYCISTIPLGCLQKETVTFTPPLPEKKRKTIQKLGMGVLDKIVLEFPKNFWGEEIEWIAKHSKVEQPDICAFLSMEYVSPGNPILVAFIEADFAKKIEAMKDEDVVQKAMNVLKSLFGNDVPNPLSYYITRWYQDPFCYGSYSFEKYGTTEKDRDVLGEPIENRLFFAGEATIGDTGTYATGAFLSGKRDAHKIIKLINKKK